MITINYKGKTYKPTDAWHFSVQAIVNDLIEKDCLEEVKENKETLYGRSIEEQIREHLATPSILEKLREMKKDMLYERKREDLDSYESGQLKVIEDLLTSLETKKCDHVSDGVVYTSNPPQYKCSKCGIYSKDFIPMAQPQFTPGQKPSITTINNPTCGSDSSSTASTWTPTPGQEIECSHTGKEWDWFKEKFTKMVGVNKDLYGVEGEESWYRFARPIEDKIDHDQVKENIRVMDEQDGVKIEPELPEVPNFNTTSELIIDDFSVLKQIEALTTFCQSLARQKPTK